MGYHRFTSISNVNWNRSNSHTTNFFTNTSNNPAAAADVTVPNNVPLNYGVPDISLSNGIEGLSETQPSFSVSQTIAFTEVLSWIHGKHNLRFGGDYRRVHRDFLAGSNATGNFAFTGLFTEDTPGDLTTGSSIADFLLGLPQSTTLNSSEVKSYLRDNVVDAYAMDDWRMLPSFTLNYGMRWEFFAPYTEKYGRLADVATNADGGFTSEKEQTAGMNGLPGSLVFPWRKAFQPRVGLAWRVPKIKQTVVRAGFGTNYTVGEYATFATTMAHQPPFTNEQTNQEANGNTPSIACAQTLRASVGSPTTLFLLSHPRPGRRQLRARSPLRTALRDGVEPRHPEDAALGHRDECRLQRLAIESPRRQTRAARAARQPRHRSDTNPVTNRSQSSSTTTKPAAYYKMNAGTVRVNKRLSKGIALGANYQYGHAIDDASSVNGSSGSVVQDWQNLAAEEGHSVLDIRHQVSGTYLFELPFGPDKFWVTSGVGSHILEGFSVSGTFNFATGTWLSPGFEPTSQSVECGNTSGLRPNLTGQSVTAGGGSLRKWFNTAAYSAPTNTPGFCDYFGNAPRDSIEGPGTVSNNMALSKTMQLGETRSMEIRATINNVFNTVQYSGVNATYGSPKFGEVTSVDADADFPVHGEIQVLKVRASSRSERRGGTRGNG